MKLCLKCNLFPQRQKHPYCLKCHRETMKIWRKSHPLTPEQKKKDNCRSYAYVYLKRGKLKKKPCQNCGSLESQMHHPDYNQPLFVSWLCRSCHLLVDIKIVYRETFSNKRVKAIIG